MNTKNKSYCSVPQCNQYGGPGISFHGFPKDNTIRKKWILALKIGKSVSNYMKVCGGHFKRDDYILPGISTKRPHLKKNAIPSKNLPVSSIVRKRQLTPEKKARECRLQKRQAAADGIDGIPSKRRSLMKCAIPSKNLPGYGHKINMGDTTTKQRKRHRKILLENDSTIDQVLGSEVGTDDDVELYANSNIPQVFRLKEEILTKTDLEEEELIDAGATSKTDQLAPPAGTLVDSEDEVWPKNSADVIVKEEPMDITWEDHANLDFRNTRNTPSQQSTLNVQMSGFRLHRVRGFSMWECRKCFDGRHFFNVADLICHSLRMHRDGFKLQCDDCSTAVYEVNALDHSMFHPGLHLSLLQSNDSEDHSVGIQHGNYEEFRHPADSGPAAPDNDAANSQSDSQICSPKMQRPIKEEENITDDSTINGRQLKLEVVNESQDSCEALDSDSTCDDGDTANAKSEEAVIQKEEIAVKESPALKTSYAAVRKRHIDKDSSTTAAPEKIVKVVVENEEPSVPGIDTGPVFRKTLLNGEEILVEQVGDKFKCGVCKQLFSPFWKMLAHMKKCPTSRTAKSMRAKKCR